MFSLIKNNYDRNKFNNEFPLLFDDVFSKHFIEKPSKFVHNTPSVNIKETDKLFELIFAAPGLEKKDFKIELKNDVLTVSATQEHKTEETNNTEHYTRKEFNYQSFSRSFTFSENKIEKENIQAKYENGILSVTVPKKQTEVNENHKQIEIA